MKKLIMCMFISSCFVYANPYTKCIGCHGAHGEKAALGKSQGTGIGLYMSYEMVQKLFNGEMKVENETFFYEKKEYLGAKFTITIKL